MVSITIYMYMCIQCWPLRHQNVYSFTSCDGRVTTNTSVSLELVCLYTNAVKLCVCVYEKGSLAFQPGVVPQIMPCIVHACQTNSSLIIFYQVQVFSLPVVVVDLPLMSLWLCLYSWPHYTHDHTQLKYSSCCLMPFDSNLGHELHTVLTTISPNYSTFALSWPSETR